MNSVVYPILIMLVLGWAAFLGYVVTQRARRNREIEDASRESFLETHREQMGYTFPDRPLIPIKVATFGPCKTDKRGGGDYETKGGPYDPEAW